MVHLDVRAERTSEPRLALLQILASFIGIGYAFVAALLIGLEWPSLQDGTFLLIGSLYVLVTWIAPEEMIPTAG
jgi:hypothetical protein